MNTSVILKFEDNLYSVHYNILAKKTQRVFIKCKTYFGFLKTNTHKTKAKPCKFTILRQTYVKTIQAFLKTDCYISCNMFYFG